MIRCNNCGWFNLNTATSCEKCGEALDLTLVEEPKEELHEPSDTPVPSPASPLAETEPKLMNKTVRLGEDEVAPHPKKSYGATVLDAGAVIKEMEEDVSYCPKCRYPLVSHPEFCPNCGTTLRRDTRKDAVKDMNATIRETDGGKKVTRPAASSSGGKAGKATIRDIPPELLQDTPLSAVPEKKENVYRLVPVAGEDYPIVYMSVGDIVTINGLRFRFEK